VVIATDPQAGAASVSSEFLAIDPEARVRFPALPEKK
jgi:hypothetical protein